jgi:hypothetical protein
MPMTRRDDPAESLRLALIGLDAQIAELQETRAQLAALIERPSRGSAVKVAAPRKRRKLSAAARAKISAAAKARWAKERKAKSQKPKPAAKKAQSKARPTKARPAATSKARKSPAKKSKSKPPAPAAETIKTS